MNGGSHVRLSRITSIFVSLIVVLTIAACAKEPSHNNPDNEPTMSETTPIVSEPKPEPQPITNEITAIAFATEQFIAIPGSEVEMVLHATGTLYDIDNVFTEAEENPVITSSNEAVAIIHERGVISIPDTAPIGSSATIHAQFNGLGAELYVIVSYNLSETVEVVADGIGQVTNPEAIAVIVNKERSLPPGYEPDDLVKPNVPFSFSGENERNYMREEAARALESLFQHAEEEGIILNAVSGYRTFATQRMLFNHYVLTDGEEEARQYSALPGTSEHQTGLAMDVSAPSIGNRIGTSAKFEETEEGKWISEHAVHHGFIIRYPEGKEHITGYVYEPWHLRYVGMELAQRIHEQEITLEEFFQTAIPVMSPVGDSSIE